MSGSGVNPAAGTIAVHFHGGDLVAGLPRSVLLEINEPVSAEHLVELLAEATGVPDLRRNLERFYAILVDGTSIQHLQGWKTLVQPGATVAVVAPMGGGSGI